MFAWFMLGWFCIVSSAPGDYSNEWAVHIQGGPQVAKQLAREFGYDFKGKIGSFDDHYLLEKRQHSRHSRSAAVNVTLQLSSDHRVLWAEQQISYLRVKRGIIDKRDEFLAYKNVRYTDNLWHDEWYLHDAKRSLLSSKMDLHVIPVWAKGITGKGISVAVLDDGLEHNHTDIQANYDALASIDLNDKDDDPFPRYDLTDENKHGTRCAGEIAMVANNGKCGVGVAYNAKVGGIRMLDGRVTDTTEGAALSHNLDHIDIFSASWGPSDDGRTVEGPGHLASTALEKGISQGRQGLGVLYVWASGNGGNRQDNCNCDGYTSSIYTISISSASQQQKSPWYAESCASTLATTYSSGESDELKIVTIDLHDGCTTAHTGTSASAPLAAGIFALLLEANPSLNWRDVQHLVVWTSDVALLANDRSWKKNGAGFYVSNRFGFGLLHAAALINAADSKTYKSVPEKRICVVQSTDLPKILTSSQKLKMHIETNACYGSTDQINYLENVQLYMNLTYSRRGALQIFLTSPSGTEVELLSSRPSDDSMTGFQNWPFMSVQTWGENPAGIWTVVIFDETGEEHSGKLDNLTLVLHGTQDMPSLMLGGPKIYNIHPQAAHSKLNDAEHSQFTEEHAALKDRSLMYDEEKHIVEQRTEIFTNELQDLMNMLKQQAEVEPF